MTTGITRLRLRLWHVLVLLAVQTAAGQGFSSVSGRNHPELKWRQASTEHFTIIYPNHLEKLEANAAAVAESAYDVLSRNLGVSFEQRIRIYLSDEDEISNGFAVRLGNGWTNIWVNAGGTATDWTGPEKWLRKVIAHELAHIFHYRATRSRLGILDVLFANPLPRFWTEGLAQYETESWDALRGDQWLRTAVLEDRLSYRDGKSIWNGRLLYAVGNSQVRYLASQYGDSTLTKILAYRRPALAGLAKVHDFDDAFRSVTGRSHTDFYDEWRRTVNVYYNTIAGQMANVDSLDGQRLRTNGQYVYDVKFGGTSTSVVVLNLQSVDRPVRRIEVIDSTAGGTISLAEGAIDPPFSVSRDGRYVAYARLGRAAHGSLINDIYLVDTHTRRKTRLTSGLRATSPALSPDATELAFVTSADGTANIFVRNLSTGEDSQRTFYAGDVQISHVSWHPTDDRLAYYVFDADGTRRVDILELSSGSILPLTDGQFDDRGPVWSPDGTRLGFTSLRDGVPNVFVSTPTDGSVVRITNVATGATLTDWRLSPSGSDELIVIAADSKKKDRAFIIGLPPVVPERPISTPPGYAKWTRHKPPATIPVRPVADRQLILDRSDYRPWANLSHAFTLVLPYYRNRDDWGVGGGTLWIEPLGKHTVGVAAGVSVPSPISRSLLAATYVNRQYSPTVGVALSRLPRVSRPYGGDVLREDRNEVDIEALWPLDWRSRPYVSTSFVLRLRFENVKPLNAERFSDAPDGLPLPESGSQISLRVGLQRKKVRPFRDNAIHPLDGWGIRTRLAVATRDANLARSYVRVQASAFRVIPVIERHRLYLYARIRLQQGTALPQDFVGLSRNDIIRLQPLPFLDLTWSGPDRVRGYRRTVVGGRVAFSSVEYRMPLVPTLRTQLLGLISLGATTLSPFVDAAVVWSRPLGLNTVYQYGTGVELKNSLTVAGLLSFTHAIGFAQPIDALGSGDYDLYYRIQTALPF